VTDTTLTLADWLLRTALGGAAVLTLGRVALAFASAAEARHRLAAATLRVAAIVPLLALLPAWWTLPSWQPTPTPIEVTPIQAYPETVDLPAWDGVPVFAEPLPETVPESAGAPAAEPVEARSHWPGALAVVAAAYVAVGTLFLAEFVVGLLALARLRRHSAPAPTRLSALAAGVVGRASLRVAARLGSPVCFGVLRPTVVLPAALADRATDGELTWVLAHEAEHLRRGDPLTGWFAGLSKALYFFAPAFWAMRRELRRSQEFLADAAAIGAGGRAADYAEFLITLTADPTLSRPTRLAHGVRARPTELKRRITMVLSTPNAPGRRRGTPLATLALLAAAVTLSGVAVINADDKPTPAADKPAKKADDAKKPDGEPKKADTVKGVEAEGTPFMLTTVNADGAAGPKTYFIQVTGKVADKESFSLHKQAVAAAKAGDWAKAEELLKAFEKANPGVRAIIAATSDAKKTDGDKSAAEPKMAGGDADPKAWIVNRRRLSPEAVQKFLDRITEAAKANDPAKLQAVLDEFQKAMAANTVRYFAAPPAPPKDPAAPKGTASAPTITVQTLPPDSTLEQALKQTTDPKARAAIQAAIDAVKAVKQRPTVPSWVRTIGPDGGATMLGQRLLGFSTLGLGLSVLPEALAAQLNLPANQGLLITVVTPSSPFTAAGVRKNDVLVKFNGETVTGISDYAEKVIAAEGKESVTATVISGGKEKTVTLTLPKSAAAKPAPVKQDAVQFQSMQMTETNGQVSLTATTNGVTYALTGKRAAGTLDDLAIRVTDGGKEIKLDTDPAKIDAKYRPAVEALLDRVRGK
jgi:beta-lactamase regulating signal transducer with metallopeptidase domain